MAHALALATDYLSGRDHFCYHGRETPVVGCDEGVGYSRNCLSGSNHPFHHFNCSTGLDFAEFSRQPVVRTS